MRISASQNSSAKHLVKFLIIISFVFAISVANASQRASVCYESGVEKVVAEASAEDFVPLLIAFRDPIPSNQLLKEAEAISDLKIRRAYVIRRLKDHLHDRAAADLEKLMSLEANGDARNSHELWLAHAYVVEVRAREFSQIQSMESVARIRYNRDLEMSMLVEPENLVEDNGTQQIKALTWGIEQIGVRGVWDQHEYGQNAIVAVIDTGLLMTHPNLESHVWVNEDEIPDNGVDDDNNGYIDDINGWNFYDNNPDITPVHYHGTCAAGLVAGDGTIAYAPTGVDTTGAAPRALIMPIRNYRDGWSSEATHPLAVQYAVANGADVTSCSMSYPRVVSMDVYPDYVTLRYAHANSLAAGLIHANSTGNSNYSNPVPWKINAPANCPGPFLHPEQTVRGGRTAVMACGMYTSSGTIHSRSDRGVSAWEETGYPLEFQDYPYDNGNQLGLLKPDVVGPTGLTTTTSSGGFRTFSGTSASTPVLAGTMAVLRSAWQQAGPEAIAEAIMMTAEDAGPAGFDTAYGAGKFRVDAALQYLDEHNDQGRLHVLLANDEEFVWPVQVSLNDGAVEHFLTSADTVLTRILPGSYDVMVSAEGFAPTVQENVTITANETTDVSFSFSPFEHGIQDASILLTVEQNAQVSFEMGVENTTDHEREFDLAIVNPEMSWENRDTTDVSELLNGNTPVAFAGGGDSLIVSAVTAEDEAVFIKMKFDGTEAESFPQPSFLGGTATPVLAVYSEGYIASRVSKLFLMDSNFAVQDSLDLTETTARIRSLAVIPGETSDTLLVNGLLSSGSIFKFDIEGQQHGVYPAGAVANKMVYHEDAQGPAVYILSRETAVYSWQLRRLDLITYSEGVAYDYETVPAEDMLGLVILEVPEQPFMVMQLLNGACELVQNKREVRRDLFDYSEHVVIPVGQGSAMLTCFGQKLAYDQDYQYELVWWEVNEGWSHHVPVTVHVTEDTEIEDVIAVPDHVELLAPYPNPFNPSVTLQYQIPVAQRVELTVYNVLGQRVETLFDGFCKAGLHSVSWQAADKAAGLYFAVLEFGEQRQTKKLILMK